jgi:hypothetical protein
MVWVGFSTYGYLTAADITIQVVVPDELRGRVMALLLMRWSFVPFGAFFMGALAGRLGLQAVVATGGLLAVLCALLAIVASRQFRALHIGRAATPAQAPAASSTAATQPSPTPPAG